VTDRKTNNNLTRFAEMNVLCSHSQRSSRADIRALITRRNYDKKNHVRRSRKTASVDISWAVTTEIAALQVADPERGHSRLSSSPLWYAYTGSMQNFWLGVGGNLATNVTDLPTKILATFFWSRHPIKPSFQPYASNARSGQWHCWKLSRCVRYGT